MYLDAAPTFSNAGYISRQTGPLVAALDIEKPELPGQPILFLWAPNLLYDDRVFATRPGQYGPWKELHYDLDSLIDADEEPRVQRIMRWIFTVWPEMKRELLQLRQSKETGGTGGADHQKTQRDRTHGAHRQ